jgi:hypothetical protein
VNAFDFGLPEEWVWMKRLLVPQSNTPPKTYMKNQRFNSGWEHTGTNHTID